MTIDAAAVAERLAVVRTDRLLVDYALRRGFYDTAQAMADAAGLDISDAITLETWFKIDELPGTGGQMGLIGKYSEGDGQRGYELVVYDQDADGDFQVFFNTSSDGVSPADTLGGATNIQAGVWYHAAATFDGTTKTVIVDGVADARTTGKPPSEPRTTDISPA